jgi:hypothetical protein
MNTEETLQMLRRAASQLESQRGDLEATRKALESSGKKTDLALSRMQSACKESSSAVLRMKSASPTRSHEKTPDQGFAAPQPVQIDQKPWKVGYWLNSHNKLWVYNHQGNCSWKLLDVQLCEIILEAFHHPDIWCLPYWAIKIPLTLY